LPDLVRARAGDLGQWTAIDVGSGVTGKRDGKFGLQWDPSKYGVREGSSIKYRITVGGQQDLIYAQEMPGRFTYKDWWSRQNGVVKAILTTGGVLLLYGLVLLTLLWLHPLSLLWLYDHVSLEDVLRSTPARPLATMLGGILTVTGMSYFAKHSRTRDAWVAQYKCGKRTFGDLSKVLRETFVADIACLDAWVEQRRAIARAAINNLPEVAEREIYIGLPIRPLKRDPGATSKAFCGERSLRRDVSHFPAIRRWEITIAQSGPFLLIFGLTVRFYAFESASESARKFSLHSRWFLLMGASTRNR